MTGLTPGRRLQRKLELAYPAFGAVAEQLWTSPRVADVYPEYLCTMHTIVRTSVPLMEAALERAWLLAPEDEVAAGVATYLKRHVHEEVGHDRWILEDLEAAGADPQEPLRRVPSRRVASVVGAQYYWLRHYHPVSLLGHIAVMEGFPPTPAFAERLRERTGYPEDAFRAIARHAKLDIGHRKELYEAIDHLPLTAEHEDIIGLSGLHTVAGLIDVFEEVLERVEAPGALAR
jgi:Iron-containing redox enzyme